MANKNIFANNINVAMMHEQVNKATGKKFFSVSIETDLSKTGMATYAVNEGQVFRKTSKDGTPVEFYRNILLGKPDGTRKLSVATTKNGSKYKTIEVTNAQIADMHKAAQKADRASVVAEPAVEA